MGIFPIDVKFCTWGNSYQSKNSSYNVHKQTSFSFQQAFCVCQSLPSLSACSAWLRCSLMVSILACCSSSGVWSLTAEAGLAAALPLLSMLSRVKSSEKDLGKSARGAAAVFSVTKHFVEIYSKEENESSWVLVYNVCKVSFLALQKATVYAIINTSSDWQALQFISLTVWFENSWLSDLMIG